MTINLVDFTLHRAIVDVPVFIIISVELVVLNLEFLLHILTAKSPSVFKGTVWTC